MEQADRTGRAGWRPGLARPAAVVLAVVAGLGGVLLGVTAALVPAGTPVAESASLGPLPAARPVALRIPALGLEWAHVVTLGRIDGRREQPGTALGIGWFADGPAPGEPGVAVLSGHAGFGYASGAFARLSACRPGQEITVRGEDGRETHFVVRRVVLFPAGEPDSTLTAPEGPGPELRLITSDGTYDGAASSGFRLAVYATPAP